jgi:hypothetical protein
MRVEFVQATADHIPAIAEHARAADVAEVQASSGATIEQALTEGLRISTRAYTALLDGEPVAMMGVNPYSELSGSGVAWMLATSALDTTKGRRAVVRCAQPVLDDFRERYPGMIWNAVDARNARAIRFLKWAGFTFVDPVPVGPEKRPFYPFYIQGRRA